MSRAATAAPPSLEVQAEDGTGAWSKYRFQKPFRIGRQKECEVFIDNSFVSRAHAEVRYEEGRWVVNDLGSANGIFRDGQRVHSIPVDGLTTLRLGAKGPTVKFAVEDTKPKQDRQEPPAATKDVALTHYIQHYFSKGKSDEPAGEHTMFIRQAYAQVDNRQKTTFRIVIAVLVVAILGAVAVVYRQHRQLVQERATAEELFYAIKSQDIDLANLNRMLAESTGRAGVDELQRFQARHEEMESSYDKYLATLEIYSPKMTERQRLIMRIARVFGECELEMPHDFEAEINRYIEYWKTGDRLKNAIFQAQQNGYAQVISRELLSRGLPPQFFYLALQESGFDPYAVGPPTRKGFAKGMWQFIPETAVKYSLHLGPLVDQRRPDPRDERDNFEKETKAAAFYLQDLYSTDAQASGFLVMACYNWGENQVLPLIQSMPANPRERNFWKLLSKYRGKLPKETYDYVFYIASAAVIGENPRLFGFDFDNPLVAQ
jgi:membrane-bound lytic murein transglycosylase D